MSQTGGVKQNKTKQTDRLTKQNKAKQMENKCKNVCGERTNLKKKGNMSFPCLTHFVIISPVRSQIYYYFFFTVRSLLFAKIWKQDSSFGICIEACLLYPVLNYLFREMPDIN